jgi:hypothetical protein
MVYDILSISLSTINDKNGLIQFLAFYLCFCVGLFLFVLAIHQFILLQLLAVYFSGINISASLYKNKLYTPYQKDQNKLL